MGKHKYLPSIDSLRALAVISVIVYHCSAKYLPGGFLGVDLFFVLSGYLISSLLINEYQKNNTINLKEFYIRRARRLLPAVYFMITVVLIILVLFNKVLLNKSYLDGLFGYIYASNWWYIFHNLDYFDTFGSNSPFKHLWSLAIEEQFYMFFPLLFLFINKLAGLNWKKILKISVIVLVVISLITHVLLYDFNNVNRVYYGTDTRMFELLVGVIGALIYPIKRLSTRVNNSKGLLFSVISILSIIIFFILEIYINEYNSYLYRGGFFVATILFLVMIITTGQQGTIMSRIMSFRPLVFIGKLSYSLYLWHFPILVLTTPTSELNDPNLIYNIIRVVIIFVVAYFSYTFIETPIRKIGLSNYIKKIIVFISYFSKKGKIITGVISIVFIILFSLGVTGKSIPYISTLFVKEYNGARETEFKTEENSSVTPSNTDVNQQVEKEEHKYNNVILIGDSLAVDIGQEFVNRYPGSIINGKVSRQVYNSLDVAKGYVNFNNKNTAVIFLLGTNGIFDEEQLKALLEPLKETDIYFINTRVPRVWEASVNKILEENQEKLNYTLVDWYSLAKNHKEYFASDQVHLQESGVIALVDLVESKLKHKIETPAMIELEKQKEAARKAEEIRKQQEEIARQQAEEAAKQTTQVQISQNVQGNKQN